MDSLFFYFLLVKCISLIFFSVFRQFCRFAFASVSAVQGTHWHKVQHAARFIGASLHRLAEYQDFLPQDLIGCRSHYSTNQILQLSCPTLFVFRIWCSPEKACQMRKFTSEPTIVQESSDQSDRSNLFHNVKRLHYPLI